MKAKILNRKNGELPVDGWYQIEVSGLHPAGAGRRQLIDERALVSIVERFAKEAAAAGEDFTGLLVDMDHLSHDVRNSTEAWAWLGEVEIREGELWGRLDLTDLGEAAIRNGRVKFFSTEYELRDLEEVEAGVVRPLRLAGLAFTNRPNNRGGRPISNREGGEGEGDFEEGFEEGFFEKSETKTTDMKNIAEKLGLPVEADEAAILAKIGELTVANAELMAAAEAAAGKVAEAEVVEILNRYTGKIPAGKAGLVKAGLLKNREHTLAMLELLDDKVAGKITRIHNRDGANAPEPVGDGEVDEVSEAVQEKERLALCESIRKRDGCSHEKAWNAARREKPELFENVQAAG